MMRATSVFRAIGCEIRLVVTDTKALPAASSTLRHEITKLDRACSRFRRDSELRQLEQRAGDVVAVSPTLAGALDAALWAAAATAGLVNPAMGHHIEDLGYDRDFVDLPAAKRGIDTVRIFRHDTDAWRDIELDVEAGDVRLPAGIRIDLGATAKAWAADRCASLIHDATGSGVLVALGGDIAVAGPSPGNGWPIRIQDATAARSPEATGPTQVVSITTGGLATSSTIARRWKYAGDPMHHILDPRTGRPAMSPWRTASVAAPSCLEANAASTGSIIQGSGALAWLAELAVPARLVATDGKIVTTSGWPAEELSAA